MPWGGKTVEDLREEFVLRVLSREKSKSALCKEYHISRPTGDLWIKRYLEGKSLADLSHRPFHVPHRTDPETERDIVLFRQNNPSLGAVTIRKLMMDDGYKDLPCVKTFNNIFARNHLITPQNSASATPYKRFAAELPNDMWQGDFKGYFPLDNGQRGRPLDIIDDHTRFNLCCQHVNSETFEEIKLVMIRLFQEYGLPKKFLCDNGNPWGTTQSTGFTRFEVWLMELGILTLHGRALHPQTQGKIERFHRTLKKDCLQYADKTNVETLQRELDLFRYFYNYRRPHHALKLETPGSLYCKSPRPYRAKIEPWEYGKEYVERKIKSTGYITFNGQGYYLSEALGGKTVGVRESHKPGELTIVFRQFRIARFDPYKRVFTLKRISKIDRHSN